MKANVCYFFPVSDVSSIRFHLIPKHVPNYPDAATPQKIGTILKNVSAEKCLLQCANDRKCELFTYRDAKKDCYLSNLDPNLLSRGLFRDEDAKTFVLSRGND